MPGDQRGGLDDDQCVAPVEPAGEPDQGETGGKGGRRPRTEPEMTHTIDQQDEQWTAELSKVTDQAHKTCHR